MAVSQFKNFQASARRPFFIPFGVFPSGADLSWIPSYAGPPDEEVPIGSIDGSNASFTISRTFTAVKVFLNGVKLKEGTGFTVSGPVVTFLTGYIPQSGDSVEVEVW